MEHSKIQKKRFHWNQRDCQLFELVVHSLRKDATPRKILHEMSRRRPSIVDRGVTRDVIASHLQKERLSRRTLLLNPNNTHSITGSLLRDNNQSQHLPNLEMRSQLDQLAFLAHNQFISHHPVLTLPLPEPPNHTTNLTVLPLPVQLLPVSLPTNSGHSSLSASATPSSSRSSFDLASASASAGANVLPSIKELLRDLQLNLQLSLPVPPQQQAESLAPQQLIDLRSSMKMC